METVGRYRLVRRIGAGSFATVWLGRDDDLDVDVAVKILADNWAGNDNVRNRFLAEARLMRRIRDPRVVRVYDIGSLPDGRPYFVMDHCDAGSLQDLRREPTDPATALHLCAEACRALAVVHRAQVVHRDVTPGNLLLDRSSGSLRVMLADLGVAKEMVEQAGATMTAGTPAYMAPEQATGDPLGPRSDLYAMACVTYAVLTGQPPFPVRSVQDLLRRPPGTMPPLLSPVLGTPPRLDEVLIAALSFDPALRPPSAEIMAEELDRAAAQLPMPERIQSTQVRPRLAGPLPDGQLPSGPPPHWPHSASIPPTPTSLPPTTHPSGISQVHGPLPVAEEDDTPLWQHWTLVGLIALLVFLGVIALTIVALG
ncbi:serine/threonine protein kinase [Propionibacteriaceae bacterium ES.041]|uniref:serine/threonine-protein kinase n=1 Tax=Enemella evansiae TaxID=2016499 RepID=UPI000B9696A8|nr:serine/threonine-protein kinase [Enemella evansiae]OYO11432.1 serine/threonine protein kinase [Enemella evansiae]PFG66335.1 serine/threonine protein kinase [Propionibacteriaceae bacterium ES.041]TDO88072.1 serine/threonine protein kinase [Enemella evansiae]